MIENVRDRCVFGKYKGYITKKSAFADFYMVHQTRLELARVTPYAPQAYVSADSTTGACLSIIACLSDTSINLLRKLIRFRCIFSAIPI